MWQVLTSCRYFVLKLLECFLIVSGHGQMHLALVVVPVERDADVLLPRLVRFDIVARSQEGVD